MGGEIQEEDVALLVGGVHGLGGGQEDGRLARGEERQGVEEGGGRGDEDDDGDEAQEGLG